MSEDLLSNGSSTPAASISFKTGTPGSRFTAAEARRPKPKPVSLNGARRALWRTIRKLASVKTEEVSLINAEIESDEEVLGKIDAWGRKYEGLQNSIQNIADGSEEGARANTLRHEAESLGIKIQELEARLMEMKSRHRIILQEVSRLENSIQARLSSYRESLGIVEKEMKAFLDRPPIDSGKDILSNKSKKGKSRVDDFMALPPKRRTMEMARGHWEQRRQGLERKREGAEFEREALEEGAIVWQDVLDEVVGFERKLREHMHRANSNEERSGDEEKQYISKGLLQEMDNTIVQIEGRLKLAEARDWKLLECCIGAELEAFRQGKEILESAVGEETDSETKSIEQLEAETELLALNGGLLGQDPAAMTNSRETVLHLSSRANRATYDTEDDDPDPELLISHQETDGSE